MKSVKTCECAGKSKCIVITIETCCKKGSDDKKHRSNKMKGDPGDKSVKRVTSGPVVTERSATSFTEDEKDLLKTPSSISQPNRNPSIEEEPLELEEGMGDGKDDSKTRFSDIHVVQHQRLFKLPLVTERHHGAGCAMEISVLEKHEDSCLYKKEDIDGRNPQDDRCGSYDCIGRMVFRTCNSTETESDSEKPAVHGGSSGKKSVLQATPSQMDKPVVQVLPPRQDKTSQTEITSADLFPSKAGQSQASNLRKGGRSERSSLRRQKSHSAEVVEEPVKSRSIVPEQSMPPPRQGSEKKHYAGDGCKLHNPKGPMFLTKHMHRSHMSAAAKPPPAYADIALQTDNCKVHRVISSEEIVGSYSDVKHGAEKRRPSFLGSIFRRHNSGSKSSGSS